MNEREKIVGRIREALSVPAPIAHGTEGAVEAQPRVEPTTANARQWLPSVGQTFEARLDLFRNNAATLKADFRLVNSRDELANVLLSLREAEGWQKIGAHGGDLTDFACEKLALPVCRTDQKYNASELEACNVGITECDALVAQTGSVVVTARSAGGRALSVLPPHHVVLARRGQLLGDLPEAFAMLKERYAPNYPSFISFITGPSRTGDIERILVLGAHGPKKLTIICF